MTWNYPVRGRRRRWRLKLQWLAPRATLGFALLALTASTPLLTSCIGGMVKAAAPIAAKAAEVASPVPLNLSNSGPAAAPVEVNNEATCNCDCPICIEPPPPKCEASGPPPESEEELYTQTPRDWLEKLMTCQAARYAVPEGS